ncbi:unnamed protein product, partial [Gadus morhua 'NCC']
MVESSSTVSATERQAVCLLPGQAGEGVDSRGQGQGAPLTDPPPGTNNQQMAGQMWAGGDLGHHA